MRCTSPGAMRSSTASRAIASSWPRPIASRSTTRSLRSANGRRKPTARATPIFEIRDIVEVPFPYTDRPLRQNRPALVIAAGDLEATHGLPPADREAVSRSLRDRLAAALDLV